MEGKDESLDPKSPKFNPLKALYSKRVPLPNPSAPLLGNFNQETVLNPKSQVFDPLKALYSKDVQLPVPNAPILDNLHKFISMSKLKESPQTSGKPRPGSKRDDKQVASTSTSDTPARRFLPHQQMVPGHRPARTERNLLTRMRATTTGPLSVLRDCMERRVRIKVWTRNMVGMRGYCIAFIAAFDKHWNLALEDVTEVWTRKKKLKTAALGTPKAVPTLTWEGNPRPQPPRVCVIKTDRKTETCERHVDQLMIRGEQIAIISVL